ncbi:VOC family protein [Chitinophaga sp. Mgbs1]|uniref:VOC family protein n=1 Tax=Chitinophaga solisilvae TaxID=1233460 RepID=A0A3S1AV22_9BACT|nr:VOC family protein [Chitinophaga solisilvae]
MAAVNPYLTFAGNCEEAFNFYKSVFGGEFLTISRFAEIPAEYKDSAGEDNLVMHVALPIGSTILMGSDSPAHMGPVNAGNNFSIAISPDSEADADRIFNGLAAGGKITMPLDKAFWGAYFGMVTDKFGIAWMVNYDHKS